MAKQFIVDLEPSLAEWAERYTGGGQQAIAQLMIEQLEGLKKFDPGNIKLPADLEALRGKYKAVDDGRDYKEIIAEAILEKHG